MIDWHTVRDEFPAVSKCTYVNTAAGGPISRTAAAAGAGYYEATRDDGDVHWDEWLERVESVRERVARRIGATPPDVAFVQNTSHGLNLAARMLTGREVLLVEGDFPSVTWPWMQQGFDVRFAPAGADGGARLADLDEARGERTGVLALGSVHYRTGYRYDLGELSAWCREREIVLVVDATQALGAVTVDLAASPVDFLVSSAYKWLNAGYGLGIAYVHPRWRRPDAWSAVGWRSARDPYALRSAPLDVTDAAFALEAGHPPFAGVFTLGAALEIQDAAGPERIVRRDAQLAHRVREGLDELGIRHLTAPDPRHRSPIVAAVVPDPETATDRLEARGVLVSARGGTLRISTHFYNLEQDVDALLEGLRALRSSS